MENVIQTVPGLLMGGGFYVGRILMDDGEHALIVAPKAEGELPEAVRWHTQYGEVPGCHSDYNGLANTEAMAAAGIEVAQWARKLRIGGFDDWCIPAQDQIELCYRYLKPGTDTNSLFNRSGINVSAVPPTRPYTRALPVQTPVEAFRTGGVEAFEEAGYWSSTPLASHPNIAWMQWFVNGYQYYFHEDLKFRVRAVRTTKL